MAINKRSRLDDFTRGSDAIWHRLHMATAGFQRLTAIVAAVALPTFLILVFLFTDSTQREILAKHYLSEFLVLIGQEMAISLPTRTGSVRVSADQAAEITSQVIGWHGFMLFILAVASIAVGVFVAKRLAAHQVKVGADEATDNFLRGQKLVSEDELSKLTEAQAKTGYRIGSVGVPDALMTRNAAFIGSMGTGKSQALSKILDVARPTTKAVIYDVKGDFVQRYYDPARGDIILNPLDLRCAAWSIFDDMQDDVDYRTAARFFIPDAKGGNGQNQVFVDGARVLLQDAMKLVKLEPCFEKNMSTVAYVAARLPLPELHKYLVKYDLDSADLMTEENRKTATQFRIQIITAPALGFFKLFSAQGFSIRRFIESDSPGWLFLSSNAKQHDAIAPFVAVWLELAALAALSGQTGNFASVLTQFSIDELASLPRLNSLEKLMMLGRDYGIGTLLGFQNVAQGQDIYGHEAFRTMLANAQTKGIFRTEDFESAKALADFLGAQEVDEATAGQTHSTDAAHDSSQINRKRVETNLVMASEILILPDLTAYLKVSGAYPVAKVKIPYVARPDIAAAYEPRALPTIEARDPLELANEAAAVAAELDAADGLDAVPLEHEHGGLF